MLQILQFDKSFRNNNDWKRIYRKIWLLIALFLVGGCFISNTEIKKGLFIDPSPTLCLEDDLTLITNTGYRFQKPSSNRLHKASLFFPLYPWKLKSDAALKNSFFSGETFLPILVIILFFYFYRLTGEDGKNASSFIKLLLNCLIYKIGGIYSWVKLSP